MIVDFTWKLDYGRNNSTFLSNLLDLNLSKTPEFLRMKKALVLRKEQRPATSKIGQHPSFQVDLRLA